MAKKMNNRNTAKGMIYAFRIKCLDELVVGFTTKETVYDRYRGDKLGSRLFQNGQIEMIMTVTAKKIQEGQLKAIMESQGFFPLNDRREVFTYSQELRALVVGFMFGLAK